MSNLRLFLPHFTCVTQTLRRGSDKLKRISGTEWRNRDLVVFQTWEYSLASSLNIDAYELERGYMKGCEFAAMSPSSSRHALSSIFFLVVVRSAVIFVTAVVWVSSGVSILRILGELMSRWPGPGSSEELLGDRHSYPSKRKLETSGRVSIVEASAVLTSLYMTSDLERKTSVSLPHRDGGVVSLFGGEKEGGNLGGKDHMGRDTRA
ncbi:hypothetical protein BGW80DRAFT_1250121 [Lactifluus volemus]|nr:hypothetical protein BGW80DRAFT_1250121 [Lactifluus volemus]